MRRKILLTSVAVLAFAALGMWQGGSVSDAQQKNGPMLSHDVYFTLKDNSPAAKKKLVDSCKKYLKGHDGEVFFAAGPLAGALKREVNDLDFDVALHIVFKDMASHDKYQTAKRHIEFINEGKDNWKKVRVFDSLVEQ